MFTSYSIPYGRGSFLMVVSEKASQIMFVKIIEFVPAFFLILFFLSDKDSDKPESGTPFSAEMTCSQGVIS